MAELSESRSLTLPAVLRSPTPSSRKHASPFQRRLRRFRRNRFWLLLFLWLAAVFPGLILHTVISGQIPGSHSAVMVSGTLPALAAAMIVFVLCTAIPCPRVNYGISTCYTGILFLFCVSRLVSSRTDTAIESICSLFPALWASLPLILLMGLPFFVMAIFGRQLFSFRPLKRWQQHIPMVSCTLLILVLTFASLFSEAGADTPVAVVPEEPTAPHVTPEQTAAAPSITGFSANILDLDLDNLAHREEQEAVAEIHRYFAGRTPSLKNSKTGIFEGCSLIQITAGPLGQISQESAPALWKLMTGGYLFAEHHAAGDTSVLLTGSLSGNTRETLLIHQPLTMSQQLIREGYSVFACSGRNWKPLLEHLGYEWTDRGSGTPLDAIDRTFSDCVRFSPFHVFYAFENSETLQELDQAVGLLLNRLESAGILEDTVVLLTIGDLCVIWRSGLIPETVSHPTGDPDLLPTLSNLFGLEFDSRLYMGRDVFSDAPPLVILPDRSWITELAIYDAGTGKTVSLRGDPPDREYTDTICSDVDHRFAISERIVEYDYWHLLFE